MKGKRITIALNKLRGNSGQIIGLPANPRKWTADNVSKLRKSLERDANEKKYGIELTEHQCGSCYKCAYEYIVRCAVTGNVTSEEYLRKCVGILRGEKRDTYDMTQYSSASDWARGTFGDKVGGAVLIVCKKYNAI